MTFMDSWIHDSWFREPQDKTQEFVLTSHEAQPKDATYCVFGPGMFGIRNEKQVDVDTNVLCFGQRASFLSCNK